MINCVDEINEAAEAETKTGLVQVYGTIIVDGALAIKLYWIWLISIIFAHYETTVGGTYVGMKNEPVGP